MTTSVDIQGMQFAQEDFQMALDQMNSVYSAMTEEQDTLGANWSGMAASAFGQALGAWLDDLYQIRQELVVMTESLSTHTGIYSDANEGSRQVVAAFEHGLEGLAGLPTELKIAIASPQLQGRLLPKNEYVVARRRERLLTARAEDFTPWEQGEPLLPVLRLESQVKGVPETVPEIVPAETEHRVLEPELPALLPTVVHWKSVRPESE